MTAVTQLYRSPSLTPPMPRNDLKRDHDAIHTVDSQAKRRRRDTAILHDKLEILNAAEEEIVATRQKVLLLHGAKERYVLTESHDVPVPKTDREMLVKVQAIGLNPIDWKAP